MNNKLILNYKVKKKNYNFWLKRLNKKSNLVCSKDEG